MRFPIRLFRIRPKTFIVVIVAFSVLIAGCAVDPDFNPPEPTTSSINNLTTTSDVPQKPPETAENGLYSAAEIKQVEEEILSETNNQRANHGLEPLERNDSLDTVADYYSWKMWNENFYSHESPQGNGHEDRLFMYGIWCMGTSAENLNHGPIYDQESPILLGKNLVSEWMNSSGHREAILTSEFSYIGVGVFVNDSEVWAVQLFCERIELEEGSIADRRASQERNSSSQDAVSRLRMQYKLREMTQLSPIPNTIFYILKSQHF